MLSKKIRLTALSLTAMMLTSTAFADSQNSEAEIFQFAGETWAAKTTNPPTIDGVLEPGEWNTPISMKLNSKEQATHLDNWQGADDLSANFKLLWDDKYVYFGATVRDDVFARIKLQMLFGRAMVFKLRFITMQIT